MLAPSEVYEGVLFICVSAYCVAALRDGLVRREFWTRFRTFNREDDFFAYWLLTLCTGGIAASMLWIGLETLYHAR